MKYILMIFLLIGFSGSNLSSRQEKKVVKLIEKTWDLSPLKIAEIEFEDQTQDLVDGHYFVIKVSDRILGYAAGRRVIDNYLNYFPLFIFNTSFEVVRAGILEVNTIKGAEINSRRWLKQFHGYKGGDLKYGQNIDAVSGATLSGLSMVREVKLMQKLISNNYSETGVTIAQ